MGFLDSLTGGNVGKAAAAATKKNRTLINKFDRQGQGIINTGEARSSGAINKAIAGYDPYTSAGRDATSMYSNALGLGGDDGTAAAQGAFQAGPGYDFAMDQGTQAALRGASAAGMLNSGNTLTALTQYGQGLANQEYGSWLDRLQGLSSQGLSATGGQASAYGGLSDLYQGTADDRLGLASNVVQARMGNNNQLAQVREQQSAAKGSFLGGLLNMGVGLGTKALTGGLF
ncbi:hypothetical protein N181_25275 [Sinorhizobium fredii USDA 205]|uniref:Tail fiber domain-containing protein n=2 Tax=Sinorhizobium TaxID=28105 RepID=A0A844AF22_RHIFR|nr:MULTISPECIES: hypothetical protein [Sinorhizobium]KSV83690.1 hypothetical protein N181_25275 [Sinorhizobium fredii USDA 205]MQX10732.1 hypothetical protein [Sinorhizobium fredii]OAP40358.1 hypothetical protein AU381_00065 [Sinorhizobium glycinis]GEC33560.1 hypothetical protein EFR01_37310 [Sinorhizobium fredii]GLS11861.1 hypothetical protein GCM10007864_54930 [Sinorhizobium fredii]